MTQARPHVEVLELVLGYLVNAQDLVRCTAVSREWAIAVSQKQYTSLSIEHASTDLENKTARKQIRWVQSLQRRQCLRQLSSLQLHSDAATPATSSYLSNGLLILAGGWHLERVELQGPFCITTAIDLLPETLSAIDLWPDLGPATIRLAEFHRFCKLRMLRLGFDDYYNELGQAHNFVIDTSAAALTHLAVHCSTHCTMSPDCNIASCLPNIQYISMQIIASNAGLDLAQDIIGTALTMLRWVDLELRDADYRRKSCLVIPFESSVECLHLMGPTDRPLVELKVEKKSILYDCVQVLRVHVSDKCLPLLSQGLSRLKPEDW